LGVVFPGSEYGDQLAEGARFLRRGDLSEALAAFKSVYAGAEKGGNADLMAASLCEIAWTCFKLGDPDQGLECAMASRLLWRRLKNNAELVRALAVEAFLFLDLGFADEAFDLSTQSLNLSETLDDPAMRAFALATHGLILAICQESDLALTLMAEAVELGHRAGNSAATAFYALNLGFAHARFAEAASKLAQVGKAQDHQVQAIEFSTVATKLAEDAEDSWTLRVSLCNTAELLSAGQKMNEARACLDRWLAVPGMASASLHIHYLYTRALVDLAAGDFASAKRVAEEALCLAEVGNQIDHQVNSAHVLSRILEAQGQAAAALDMHKRYHKLYVQQTGESVRRRARVEEIRAETDQLRARMAELADQAFSDPLTGISNRRSFDQILDRLAGSPVAVAIVDLDNFKRINDRHTHIAGDAVLQRVARVMVDQIATHGHVARLGGEEFALIFPEAPLATAAAFCEGIRVAIANAEWDTLAPGMRVTVSIGVAAGDGTHPTGELMQRADSRLYLAKQGGRDRVVAEDLPAAARQAEAAG
jgi:diguanylate cyclase (GGDEF)-like protein